MSKKRLVSILLALVMVMALSIPALAVNNTTYTITIENSTNGYVYTAYQIFTGDLSGTGTQTDPYVLSNIEWGNGVDTSNATLQAALTAAYGSTKASDIAEKLVYQADAEAFADLIGKYLVDGTGINSGSTSPYTISVTGSGYYLVKNTQIPSGYTAAYTNYILQVVNNVTVSPKTAIPSSDKTVSDIEDSTTTAYTAGQTSADHDIGDVVPFTLTATMPTNYLAYDSYQLTFHDEMDAGLTFDPTSVVVSVGAHIVDPSCYNVATDAASGLTDATCTFEVQITDTNKLVIEGTTTPIIVTHSTVITVSYTAQLNESAVIGNPGNANTSYISYSNDPTWNGTGTEPTGDTPEKTVVVFTYELTVNKVDANNNPLDGAKFTLYKYSDADQDYVAVTTAVYTAGTNTFTWSGLDDGEYKLVETTVPRGYNKMEDLYFEVIATHTASGITSLEVVDEYGEPFMGTLTFDVSATDGTMETDIMNGAGSTLPVTGGIGTTIFYIVGFALVFGAAVLLITRRRMRKAE